MRLVVLGGSGSSTPELFDALADWPGGIEHRPPLEVVLVGRTLEKLYVVVGACRARIGPGPQLTVSGEADRRRALERADVVLNQVRIGGYAARAFDESFPWQAGIPGEETMGPGGFANAVRTVPALRPTWRDIAEVAPGALVINLTNPAGIVQAAALAEHPELNVVSVCDSPMPILDRIVERLGRDPGRVWARYLGMNHLGWYVPEPSDGAGQLDALADLAMGNDPLDVRLQQAIAAPYVRYYLHPDRILAVQQGKPTRAQSLQELEASLLAGYRADPGAELPRRGAVVWYRMAVLRYLDAWIHGTAEAPVMAGILNGGRIADLPPDVVVELPHVAHGPADLRPLEPAALPPLPAAMLRAHAAYESLAARALAPGADAETKIRALAANPMVRDTDRAAALWHAIEAGPMGWGRGRLARPHSTRRRPSLHSDDVDPTCRRKRVSASGPGDGRARIAIENVNHPGSMSDVDAAMYLAMRRALLGALPDGAPGMTESEMRKAVRPLLPADLFPGGAKAGWWSKAVQLDLEAKRFIARESSRPLRWHRNPDRRA